MTTRTPAKRQKPKEKPMISETAIVAVAPPPEPLALTVQEIRANVNLIQQVLKSVFKKDVHYGTIPGTPKPTLYKPGAEKIMVLFRLNAKPVIEDLSSADEIRYRVSLMVTHQVTRHEIGWGVGECSSNETKYKWIGVKFPSDWNNTTEDRRRTITKMGRDGKPHDIQQIRASIADVANTVLKMAKKRALVDATLTCTAASDVFDQDIEDMPEGLRQNMANTARPPMPQRASEKAAPPAPAAPLKDEFGEPPPEQPAPTPAPAAAPAPKQGVNFSKAETLTSKFNAPCRLCSKMIPAGEAILYIREGADKGRYCTEHGV